MRVEESIQNLITTQFPEVFIVDLTYNTSDLVRLTADTDEGIRLEQCEAIHRKINDLMEEAFPELNCSIEVSSPGVGKPLKLLRQYQKNTGRMLRVLTTEGAVYTGILRKVAETEIELDLPEDKDPKSPKTNYRLVVLPFSQVKESRVEIVF